MKLRKRPEALKWEQAYEFGDMKKKNVALAVGTELSLTCARPRRARLLTLWAPRCTRNPTEQ